MKKELNRKKILIFSIILIIIIAITIFFVVKYIKGNVVYIAPNMENEKMEEYDDNKLKYENNIETIDIGEIKTTTIEKKQYISIEISNKTEEDKFNLPIGIEFVNSDGDVIYNTGYVVDVLLKGMTDEVYAVVTPQIAKLVNDNEIDHIVIKELQ